MTLVEVMQQLEKFGNEDTKKVLIKHGAKEPFFGVKVADLKKILKKTKKNHELSLALYATGNSDAMYLAGLMADENKISKAQLQMWAENAYWYYLSEYAVAWVAAEVPYGLELALEWIESDQENIAAAGWSTLSFYIGLKEDTELDMAVFSALLDRAKNDISEAQNRVKSTMNGFIIASGTYLKDLNRKSMLIAEQVGKVKVNVGDTNCKIPFAPDYIKKAIDKGKLGVKRKTARC